MLGSFSVVGFYLFTYFLVFENKLQGLAFKEWYLFKTEFSRLALTWARQRGFSV